MPITRPVGFCSGEQKEFREIDYAVMHHAFECRNKLGRLCDEDIYQNDLAARLEAAGIQVETEVRVAVTYRDFTKVYFVDLVVDKAWIYELKTHRALIGEHEAQLLNYLFLCRASHGKLINFRAKRVESRFVNAAVTWEERRAFDVESVRWDENEASSRFFRETISGLLQEWGTGLDLNLYKEAICYFLGGEERVLKRVALSREGTVLGNQPFHLLTPETAFRLTALSDGISDYERNLVSLLRASPLRAIQWVNLGRRRVEFISLVK